MIRSSRFSPQRLTVPLRLLPARRLFVSAISSSKSNSTMENDTETLLVMLSSLLPESHQNLDQESLLEALLECEGNVDEAAAKLASQSSSSSTAGPSSSTTRNKRKRHVGLDAWLQKHPSTSKPPSKRVNSGGKSTRERSVSVSVDEHHGYPSPSSTSLKVKGSGIPNRTGNALARLKPPSTSATPEVPVQLPPLTLGNPEMVAKHTACTLHPQVLPPKFAIRLFETMLNEAERWDRNRFWLFERAVDSPHKNAFYVRDMSAVAGYGQKDDISDLEWKEAAHYWYASCPLLAQLERQLMVCAGHNLELPIQTLSRSSWKKHVGCSKT